MSKISLHVELLNKEQKENISWNMYGIKRDNIIIYNEDNIRVKLDLNNYILTRETSDYLIKLDFKSNEGIYNLKKYIKKFNLNIKTKKIEIKDKNVRIDYVIKMDNDVEYIYKIKYEVIK